MKNMEGKHMEKRTCISLYESTYLELKKRKTHPNQSFDELIRSLLELPIHAGDQPQAAEKGAQEEGEKPAIQSPPPSPVDPSFLINLVGA